MKRQGIVIDQEKCAGCGRCVQECLVERRIEMHGQKAVSVADSCSECGHCFAVCPVRAIEMPEYDTGSCADYRTMAEIDPEALLQGMKNRRSVRHFQDRPVEAEKLHNILEAGRYAPTGGNAQCISYLVLEEKLHEAEQAAVSFVRDTEEGRRGLIGLLDEDGFFRGAQLVILVCSTRDIDASLASSYMELAAESMGLGAFYSGFFVFAVNHSAEVRRVLQWPEELRPVTCLCLGYPSVQFYRGVPRKEAQVWRR